MKTAALLVFIALAPFSGFTGDAAGDTPAAFLVKLTDKRTVGRGDIAQDVADFAASPSGQKALASHINELAALMKDSDDVVRYWVAIALGQIGPKAKAAVPALLVALEERVDTLADKSSSSGVLFALERIEPDWRKRPEVSDQVKRKWPKHQ